MPISNDAATLAATPRLVTLGGEPHRVSPLSIADFGRLQEWVDRQSPDPFDLANAQVATGRYNAAQQQFLYRTAMELALQGSCRIGSPEADERLRSLDGFREILYLSIAKAEPGFTRADADRLYDRMTPGDLARVCTLTDVDLVVGAGAPKAETPAA